jgi:fucose permease
MADETMQKKRTQRWIVFAFFFISGILTATWSSRIPEVQQNLHLSNAALGTVLFAIPVGLLTGLTVASWLVASFGSKRVLLVTCIGCAVLLVLSSLSYTSVQLMLVLFLLGLGRTIYNLAANTSAVELQQHYSKPIIASFHGVWSLACLIAAGITTVMIVQNIGLTNHFITVAFIIILIAFLLTQKQKQDVIVKERRPFFVKPDRYLLLLGLIGLCAMLCEGAMFDWSVNYFEKVVQAKKSFRTAGYMSFILTMSLGRLIGDRLIHAFGAFRILIINGILMATGFAIAAIFPFVLPAAFGFLLIGLGDSILVPVIYMLAAKSDKMPAAYALSSVTIIGYTGFLIGPLFIGNVSQQWGMPSAFICLSVISAMIIFLSISVKKLLPVNYH